ncbi:MAG: hypothetical protein IT369_01270 [Candidatus Latescibacteria bacterium]|nr:hypothetical protein [Candidatus Latescibacterota bacterium]
MNRFTFAFAAGSLLLCGSQILLNLSLHPEHPASLPVLGEGILGLVLGTALVVSGLLGLVEGYQKAAARVHQLLEGTALDQETSARTLSELQQQQHGFWRSYRQSTTGLLLFLIGLLGLGATLYRADFLLYLVAIAFAVCTLGLVAVVLMVKGIGALRRHTRAAEQTASRIETLPPAPPPRPLRVPAKWATYTREERLRQFRRHSTLPSTS